MDLSTSFDDLVATPLAELGIPTTLPIIRSILMYDGYFVGHKLRYEGGYAIWQAGGSKMEFYDEKGNLLKTVTLESRTRAVA